MKLSKKAKVLHIVGAMNVGGTETMLMNIYREVYKEVQFDFISYYEEDAYYDNEIKKLGGEVIKIKAPNFIRLFKSIKNLMYVMKSKDYKAIHVHTLFNSGLVLLAGKLAGIKIRVVHAHTTLDEDKSIYKKIYKKIMKIIIKICATDFLACSNSAGKYLFGFNIKNNEKYKVLPNLIDYNKFLNCKDTTSLRKELAIKDDDILISHIGRFTEVKNHEFLIEVLNEMINKDKKVKAVLVGDGILRDKVKKGIKKLGLQNNIFLLGLRDDTEIILNNSDLFMLPSKFEGLGIVLLEAQACGLPCLISEAIQPEADLELGLLKRISLKEEVKYWSENAFDLIKKKSKEKEKTKEAFCKKGYELENIFGSLKAIYMRRG